jgi:hypothetical protein
MEQSIIKLTFNGTELSCPIDEGHKMVPIKPICEMIDVDYSTQNSWLKNHDFFGQLYRLAYTVGADNKERKMNCLSIFDLNSWLASISLNNRKDGSIEKQYALMAWVREQFLDDYKSKMQIVEDRNYELELLHKKDELEEELHDIKRREKELKKELTNVEDTLEKVRYDHATGQITMKLD